MYRVQIEEAHGIRHILPKHHWMLDIPAQLVRDGLIADAFVIERQHLTVKVCARHTASFDVGTRLQQNNILKVSEHNWNRFMRITTGTAICLAHIRV